MAATWRSSRSAAYAALADHSPAGPGRRIALVFQAHHEDVDTLFAAATCSILHALLRLSPRPQRGRDRRQRSATLSTSSRDYRARLPEKRQRITRQPDPAVASRRISRSDTRMWTRFSPQPLALYLHLLYRVSPRPRRGRHRRQPAATSPTRRRDPARWARRPPDGAGTLQNPAYLSLSLVSV